MSETAVITTWVVPLEDAPPEADGPDCGERARDPRADGMFVCTMGFMHGGNVHASHGTEAATLWRTNTITSIEKKVKLR
jgi:hypothetical protein